MTLPSGPSVLPSIVVKLVPLELTTQPVCFPSRRVKMSPFCGRLWIFPFRFPQRVMFSTADG